MTKPRLLPNVIGLTGKTGIISLFDMLFLNRYTDTVYCLVRLIVGLMFACHGLQLVFGMFGGMPGSDQLIMQVGGWIQLVGGFLIAFGLLTRLSAFICSGTMAVAYFMFHVAPAPDAMAKFFPIINQGEKAVFYGWFFFFVFFYGPGRWSIDALIRGRSTSGIPSSS